MGRSQQSFSKKEKEKKRRKKKEDKLQKKEERKAMDKSGALEDMIAYVDEYGNIVDSPPEKKEKEVDAESIVIGVPKKEKSDGPELYKGRVEYFNDSKGFGFIRENDRQEKYFFHVNGLIDEVGERDRVSFHLEKGLKGLNAVDIEKI